MWHCKIIGMCNLKYNHNIIECHIIFIFWIQYFKVSIEFYYVLLIYNGIILYCCLFSFNRTCNRYFHPLMLKLVKYVTFFRQDFKKLHFSQFVLMISNKQTLFYKTRKWKFQTEYFLCDDSPVYWHYFEKKLTNSLKNMIKLLHFPQFLSFNTTLGFFLVHIIL